MQEYKNKVEAILFTTGRFLTLDEIGSFSGIASLGYLKQILDEIKEDYKKRDGALEVVNENNKWKLNIKKDYLYLTEKLLTTTELDRPTQETLAIIAYKQPSIQAEVVNMRGNKSYDHIKKLKDEGFITAEKFGRTRLLKLTNKFYDYFDVVEDNLKSKLEAKEIADDK